MAFKLTYATMFAPPEEMHRAYEAALRDVRAKIGGTHALFIDGADVAAPALIENLNPADQRESLGQFGCARRPQVEAAVAAAQRAFAGWRRTPLATRVRLSMRVAELIEQRVYQIAASLSLEAGKNRMESLGETQEAADFFRGYAQEFERNAGYERALPDDPLPDWRSHNRSVLKPHGVWAVIAPFNFPLALAAGPSAAALVTGNTVVLKGSLETPWAGRLLADCIRDAGYPPGAFNYLAGDGEQVGATLVEHPDIAGITFTGSYAVGMSISRRVMAGPFAKPCIAEMGGKNVCVVTRHADLDRATAGIVRSAFGMSGQKCSALSRLYVDADVADELIVRLQTKIAALRLMDPTARSADLGPVISAAAMQRYLDCVVRLGDNGARVLSGGKRLSEGALAHGFFVAPTLAQAPSTHALFAQEMFLPVLMLARVQNLQEALRLANDSPLGLTAGCYGNQAESEQFSDEIAAGVIYLNRPQGATTGAWPGYQAFAGWKGSSSTGKAIGSFYYLPQYLREQSQTWVD